MSLRPNDKLYLRSMPAFVLALALVACGDDSGDGDDNGEETKQDASVRDDAGRDASSSTGLDASTDAARPPDAGADASTSIQDAGVDASATVDSGVPDAGSTAIPELNGCKAADYTDLSGTSVAVIKFGGAQLGQKYDPKCAAIQVGQKVRFEGSFTAHPLAKGTATGTTIDSNAGSANSPIASTTTGQSAEFTFSAAGTYPYVCTKHVPGMVGSIHVK
ncbi:MAG TPA: plastocyanin/azurin family copper-binding protein [Polyangiales bacterium]|nr:plastocyanin/azurin family copper-binding protein [Polyangiales bacterium]